MKIYKLIILNGGHEYIYAIDEAPHHPSKIVRKICRFDSDDGYYVVFSDGSELEIPFIQNVLAFTK